MKSLLWTVAVCFVSILTSSAFAQQGGSKSPAPERGSDKLDLRKLEEKYWSAKDTDFTVVQNRTYTKEKRFYISLAYGPLMNDPYFTGRNTAFSLGYYFSERMGLEFNNESGNLKDNDSVVYFNQFNGLFPDTNKFVSYRSLNFLIVPFYAKMSFWNRSIIYFDMQFGFGVGQETYTQLIDPLEGSNRSKTASGFNFDISQQLFFHNNWAVRFDIKNKFSTQERLKYRVSGDETKRNLGSFSAQDTSILLGATFFF